MIKSLIPLACAALFSSQPIFAQNLPEMPVPTKAIPELAPTPIQGSGIPGDEGPPTSGGGASFGSGGEGSSASGGGSPQVNSLFTPRYSDLLSLARVQLKESEQKVQLLSKKSDLTEKTTAELSEARERLNKDSQLVDFLKKAVGDEILSLKLNEKIDLDLKEVRLIDVLTVLKQKMGVVILFAEDPKTGKIREDLTAKSQAKITLQTFEIPLRQVLDSLVNQVDLRSVVEGAEERTILLKNWPSLNGQPRRDTTFETKEDELGAVTVSGGSPIPFSQSPLQFLAIKEGAILFTDGFNNRGNFRHFDIRLDLFKKWVESKGAKIPQDWIDYSQTHPIPTPGFGFPGAPRILLTGKDEVIASISPQLQTDSGGSFNPSGAISGGGFNPPGVKLAPGAQLLQPAPAGAPPGVPTFSPSGSSGSPGGMPGGGGQSSFTGKNASGEYLIGKTALAQVPPYLPSSSFEPGMSAPGQPPYSFVPLGDKMVALAETGQDAQGRRGVWMTAYRFDGKSFKKVNATFHPFQSTLQTFGATAFNTNGDGLYTNGDGFFYQRMEIKGGPNRRVTLEPGKAPTVRSSGIGPPIKKPKP